MSYRVAIVGATGNVGGYFLSVLEDRNFPVSEIFALASAKSAGKKVSFKGKEVTVKDLSSFDFSNCDIALFSAGGSISKEFAPIAAKQGCIVIDNSSHFRMDEDVPLIVPEVNLHHLKDFKKRNIIANPNCSTAQMVIALKPLHDAFGVKRVVVSTYQSVSGKGKAAMDELFYQTKKIYENEKLPPQQFTKRIAFNCIPHIDSFMDDGSTKEEWKMAVETKKILCESAEVTATCVRVPVFVGHSEAVNVEFEKSFEMEDIFDLLRNFPGVEVVDRRQDGGYITPVECASYDPVYVSRIRRDTTVENAINMWVVADNMLKGAALNAVQIAEELVSGGLI